MEIGSVGISGPAQQQSASVRPQTEKGPSAAQTSSAPRAEGQERNQRPEGAERPEPPKPVVNAQGQKTGTIINTTA